MKYIFGLLSFAYDMHMHETIRVRVREEEKKSFLPMATINIKMTEQIESYVWSICRGERERKENKTVPIKKKRRKEKLQSNEKENIA